MADSPVPFFGRILLVFFQQEHPKLREVPHFREPAPKSAIFGLAGRASSECQIGVDLVALAIRNAIRANRFARIIRN